MRSLALLSLAAILAAPALAADAPAKPAATQRTLHSVSGKVLKAESQQASTPKGPVFKEGRLTILDRAGHTELYRVTRRTRVTLDGAKSSFEKAAAPDAVVVRAVYDPESKELVSLALKSAPTPKPDADEPAGRTSLQGEVANTDVIGGTISIRIGGGATTSLKVGESTKILREAAGKPAEPIAFEAVKVGDRVEVHTRDSKTADEIHVGPAAR